MTISQQECLPFFVLSLFYVYSSDKRRRNFAPLPIVIYHLPITFPKSSFPLTNGRKTRALGATISGIRHRCRLRSETGWAEFGYFLRYFKMVAPRALVFQLLAKWGTRLWEWDWLVLYCLVSFSAFHVLQVAEISSQERWSWCWNSKIWWLVTASFFIFFYILTFYITQKITTVHCCVALY